MACQAQETSCRCVMGPNVLYLLSGALGVVLPVTDCLPGWRANAPLARVDVAVWRCLETACVCHLCQVSGKIGGLRPVFGWVWPASLFWRQCSNKPLPLKLNDFLSPASAFQYHAPLRPALLKQQRQLGDLMWLLGSSRGLCPARSS